MYNSYEEYMQNVLGYSMPNTYRENDNYYYDATRNNQNMQEINKLYPEIYSIIYPLVQKVCSRRNPMRNYRRTNYTNGRRSI